MDKTSNSISAGPTQEEREYGRVVVKAGTTLLTDETKDLDRGLLSDLVGQVVQLRHEGREVLLVTSGAVAAGRRIVGGRADRSDIPFRQVQAAVGQGYLIHAYEEQFGRRGTHVAQAMLTRRDLSDRLGYLNVRNTLLALLELGVVPIINENDVVAVDEIEGRVFGDNDTLSAMVANIVDADLLVLLGDVQGLFTGDPHTDPRATLIKRVDRVTPEIEGMAGPPSDQHGRGGMSSKLNAAKLATASGVDVVIVSGRESDAICRVVAGERLGTHFPATGSKVESRKRWMLSGLSNKGEILVDDGAENALRTGSSLLPAGVVAAKGSFARGDIVAIVSQSGTRVAYGIASYGAEDLTRIRSRRSEMIEERLGYYYGDEAVHRNNMVVLAGDEAAAG